MALGLSPEVSYVPQTLSRRSITRGLACETSRRTRPAPSPDSPPPPKAVLTRARTCAGLARQEGAVRVRRLCSPPWELSLLCGRPAGPRRAPDLRPLLSPGPCATTVLTVRLGWDCRRSGSTSASRAARGALRGARQAGCRPGALGSRPVLGRLPRLAGVKSLTRAPSPVLSPRGERDVTAQDGPWGWATRVWGPALPLTRHVTLGESLLCVPLWEREGMNSDAAATLGTG